MSKAKSRIRTVLILVLLSAAAYVLGWSSIFSVKSISVEGAPDASSKTLVLDKSQISVGEKLARLEPRVVQNSIEKISWVDHSRVSRNWISGAVAIHLWARVPVARYGSGFVDGGNVFFELSGAPTSTKITISASSPVDRSVAIALLKKLPIEIRNVLVEIRVLASGSVTITIHDTSLSKDREVNWGDMQDVDLKVKVYQALIALPANKKVTFIDLSAPHAPIVK